MDGEKLNLRSDALSLPYILRAHPFPLTSSAIPALRKIETRIMSQRQTVWNLRRIYQCQAIQGASVIVVVLSASFDLPLAFER